MGVAYLAVADAQRAVAHLEEATDVPSPEPTGLSDLAAAYLVTGTQKQEAHEIAKALSAAERALATDPSHVEASFNRALALERLFLTNRAREAWESYLRLDQSSGWAEEARRRADSLDRLLGSQSGQRERQIVGDAVSSGDQRQLDDAVARYPWIARAWTEAELLSSWPDAVLAGRDAQAADSLTRSGRVAGALARETGDRFLADAVAAIHRSPPSTRATLASAHRAFGEGMARYEDDARRDAARLFQSAVDDLSRAGSPFALWTRLQLAIDDYFRADLSASSTRLDPVVSAAQRADYVRLHGLCLRMRGLLHGVRGQFPEQLATYRLALRTFERARDPESVAAIHASLAENLDNLGEPQLGWFHRSTALSGLGDVQKFRRRQALLLGSAGACLQQGLPFAALSFQGAALDNARAWNQPGPVAEAYLHRAETRQRLGLREQAVSDLADARSWAEKLGDDPFASRVRARIQLAAGEIHQRVQPRQAVAELNQALEYFERVGLRYVAARAYLARGRAQIAAGDLEQASSDFEQGIRTFEQQRASARDEDIRVAFFDRPWDLFTEMIRLKAIHQTQPRVALTYAEQSRSRTLFEAVAGSAILVPPDPDRTRHAIPRDIAVVYYSVLDSGVLGWIVQQDDVVFFERTLRDSELSRLVRDSRSTDVTLARECLKRLYDELVRPMLPTIGRERALVVVPDGVLHTVSFAALIDRNTDRFLVEDRPIAVTPSLAVFLESLDRPATALDSALVVGNPRFSEPELRLPPLSEAEAEAREVAALYPRSELMIGTAATKRDFLARIGRQTVVHFAGHAISNVSFPALSRLLFAASSSDSSGSLFARDMAGHDLSAVRLVVLAGCRTSTGQIRRGEGVMSLARPFLASGVPMVMATLWDLDDRASRPLFIELHRGLRRGIAPVEALRQAQLRLIASGNSELAKPATWAAVTAVGGIAGWRGVNQE